MRVWSRSCTDAGRANGSSSEAAHHSIVGVQCTRLKGMCPPQGRNGAAAPRLQPVCDRSVTVRRESAPVRGAVWSVRSRRVSLIGRRAGGRPRSSRRGGDHRDSLKDCRRISMIRTMPVRAVLTTAVKKVDMLAIASAVGSRPSPTARDGPLPRRTADAGGALTRGQGATIGRISVERATSLHVKDGVAEGSTDRTAMPAPAVAACSRRRSTVARRVRLANPFADHGAHLDRRSFSSQPRRNPARASHGRALPQHRQSGASSYHARLAHPSNAVQQSALLTANERPGSVGRHGLSARCRARARGP